MNMHLIDWIIVGFFVSALFSVAVFTKRYTKSVADFLAANRCAGRYLLSISQGVSSVGAISFVALFTMYYKAGFTPNWWMMMTWPVSLFVMLSGWIAYRYRETRAMTMAQLFEMRYSRRFRIFCGILAWLSGIINMGVFPAVTARFFIYFCGLPHTINIFGLGISTFVLIMILELLTALLFTFLGGMVVVVITDFLQGIFCNVAFLAILVVLYFSFDWTQIITAVKAAPADASMLNPFHTKNAEGFNLAYFMMNLFTVIYGIRAWQGAQGYNAAAKNAHEAKMAGIISTWRGLVQSTLIMMLPICAFTLMHHGDFAAKAAVVQEAVNSIPSKEIQDQMLVPLALVEILPIGIMGLFVSIMLAAAIATDDTYLHSWGSIFVQDVILPFRKKELSPRQHIRLLRLSIVGVTVFIFFFSLLFRQNDYILMYFTLTGAIYIGGAGAVIVGGLYWKRGSTNGAWLAMIIGGGLAFSGLVLQAVWPELAPQLLKWFPGSNFISNNIEKFPYNGMQINFLAIICAVTGYVSGSLWDWLVLRKPEFNLERMLNRGKYAIQGEHKGGVTLPVTGWRTLLPDREFTKKDRFIHACFVTWILSWFVFFVVVTSYHLIKGTTDGWWVNFWLFYVVFIAVLGVITVIWFVIGGIGDLRYMFKSLRAAIVNTKDDGRVIKDE